MAKIKLGYTLIQHGPRLRFGLSLNQYALGAAVYHLSNNPKAPVSGWCSASKKQLAEYFGLSEKTVFNLINELIAQGWLERNPDPGLVQLGLVRTTGHWYDRIENFQVDQDALQTAAQQAQHFTGGMQNLHTPGMQNLHTPYVKITDNSNTYNNSLDTSPLREDDAKKNRAENVFVKKPGAPQRKSPPVAPPPPRSERSAAVQALLDEMAPYFHVSETKFFASFAKLTTFLNVQEGRGALDFVGAQFRAYRDGRGVEPHTLENYLGNPANDWTGAWNSCDWVAKFASRVNRAAAAQASSKPNQNASRQDAAQAAIERVLAKAQQTAAPTEETETSAVEV